VLARLNEIKGVERGLANRAGTLIRVSLDETADLDRVAEEALDVLAREKAEPTRLTGDDLGQALKREEWQEADELSAIEFRTLVARQVRGFADAEQLDKVTADNLVKIAEEVWDSQARAAAAQPRPRGGTNWTARCREFSSAFIDRAREVLTAQQLERLWHAGDRLREGEPPKGKRK
jgi:hypothetical protein